MAITILFSPSKMTEAQYFECIKRLEEAGAGALADRLFHVCFGDEQQLRVLDVWTSEDAFRRFGETLMPILQQIGIEPGAPTISQIHNTIPGISIT